MANYPFTPIKILDKFDALHVKLHLTYSGFRRATAKALKVEMVPATNACPPLFYVLPNEGNDWQLHAISSDIIMYLLKHSIEMPTQGDKPTLQDSDDFNDV